MNKYHNLIKLKGWSKTIQEEPCLGYATDIKWNQAGTLSGPQRLSHCISPSWTCFIVSRQLIQQDWNMKQIPHDGIKIKCFDIRVKNISQVGSTNLTETILHCCILRSAFVQSGRQLAIKADQPILMQSKIGAYHWYPRFVGLDKSFHCTRGFSIESVHGTWVMLLVHICGHGP